MSPEAQRAKLLRACLASEFKEPNIYANNRPLQNIVAHSKGRRCIYLLDCLKLGPHEIEKQLGTGFRPAPDHIYIALFNLNPDDHPVSLVKRYKIRGIFSVNDSQSRFIQGIRTMMTGNLWLSRKMLSDCILTTEAGMDMPLAEGVSLLSRREQQILRHVAYGESNKEIADALELSPYTIKTHLYNIYKKINVPNRLQAALWTEAFLNRQTDDGKEDLNPERYL